MARTRGESACASLLEMLSSPSSFPNPFRYQRLMVFCPLRWFSALSLAFCKPFVIQRGGDARYPGSQAEKFSSGYFARHTKCLYMLNTTSNTLESQWLTVMKFIYSVVVAALESRLFNYGL